MTVNDILMFIVHGLINSQVWQSTLFFRITAQVGTMAEGEFNTLVESFGAAFLDNVIIAGTNLFSNAMTFEGVRGENLFNVAAIGAFEYDPAPIGGALGTPTAQFDSWQFSTPSQRRGMNPGKRRYPGVTEPLVGSFGAADAVAITAGGVIADWFNLDLDLDYGDGSKSVTLRPVIVKRVREGDGTPESPYEYRLPRTAAEGVTYRANGWTFVPTITTQNSRKTGRGI